MVSCSANGPFQWLQATAFRSSKRVWYTSFSKTSLQKTCSFSMSINTFHVHRWLHWNILLQVVKVHGSRWLAQTFERSFADPPFACDLPLLRVALGCTVHRFRNRVRFWKSNGYLQLLFELSSLEAAAFLLCRWMVFVDAEVTLRCGQKTRTVSPFMRLLCRHILRMANCGNLSNRSIYFPILSHSIHPQIYYVVLPGVPWWIAFIWSWYDAYAFNLLRIDDTGQRDTEYTAVWEHAHKFGCISTKSKRNAV